MAAKSKRLYLRIADKRQPVAGEDLMMLEYIANKRDMKPSQVVRRLIRKEYESLERKSRK